MTSDLSENVREELRGPPARGFRTSQAPIVQLRKSGAGLPRTGCPEKSGHVGLQGPGRRGRSERLASLRAELVKLQTDLGEADELLFQLQPGYDMLKAAFYAADDRLHRAWAGKDHGEAARALRRPLYDARMATSQDWHPIKQAYRKAETWRRAITSELRRINAEMET